MNNFQKQIKSTILSITSRLFGMVSFILRLFIKIDNNSILLWSWGGRQYGCNPKAISEYITTNHNDGFIIYWSFKKKIPDAYNEDITPLKWGSWKYLTTALKCKFLISNTRNNIETMLFYKRKSQIYIMTWHAGLGLKKVEKDAEKTLDKGYIRKCKFDSKICDLMISGSDWQTRLIKKSFWYDGEILNHGIPRNDKLFIQKKIIRENIREKFSIKDSIIVLYAPTFRSIFNANTISFNWELIKKSIKNKFQKNATLLVRLHPNINEMSMSLKFNYNQDDCIDVTSYPDMQELLVASDILITDYSSSMFDFALMSKPCFLLAKDYNKYERGFYFSLDELPFEVAYNDAELEQCIQNFNQISYNNKVRGFNEKIGSFERGNACEYLYKWICNNKYSN